MKTINVFYISLRPERKFFPAAAVRRALYEESTYQEEQNHFRASASRPSWRVVLTAVPAYTEAVAEADDTSLKEWLMDAQLYNAALPPDQSRFKLSEEEKAVYESLLNVSGKGIMGYVEIPGINVSLPIYHGSDKEVLQAAVGHIEGSSLPVGGDGTHCVISGHRGLPSSKLFTDLDQLTKGDIFILRVLGEALVYEVDQIRIVEPDDTSLLGIEEGQDLCTLMTCTPYGINSHRLLVRGHRIEDLKNNASSRVTADAILIDPMLTALVLAVPVLLILLLWGLFKPPGQRY